MLHPRMPTAASSTVPDWAAGPARPAASTATRQAAGPAAHNVTARGADFSEPVLASDPLHYTYSPGRWAFGEEVTTGDVTTLCVQVS